MRRWVGKEGISGWRAATVVFGCGVAAALLVFGTVVGGMRVIYGAFSNPETPEDSSAMKPKPRASLEVDKLALCEFIQSKSILGANRNYREDSGGNYKDKETGDKGRVVSDECHWEVSSPKGGKWKFGFTFNAFASSTAEKSMTELANDDYDRSVKEVGEMGVNEKGGEVGKLSFGKSEGFYAYSPIKEGFSQFSLLVKAGSAIYRIDLEDSSHRLSPSAEATPAEEFIETSSREVQELNRLISNVMPDDPE